LQLQPEKEILFEYLLAEEFKWVPLSIGFGGELMKSGTCEH